MSNIKIKHLSDHPDFIDACAAWSYGRWGVLDKNVSLKIAFNKFSQCKQKDTIPLTLIAIDEEKHIPVAMGSIWESDCKIWHDKTPWIASIYTHYRYRGQGIARSMITCLEKEAKRLGYHEIYLKSGSAAAMYPKLGYEALDVANTNQTLSGTETLFQKELS